MAEHSLLRMKIENHENLNVFYRRLEDFLITNRSDKRALVLLFILRGEIEGEKDFKTAHERENKKLKTTTVLERVKNVKTQMNIFNFIYSRSKLLSDINRILDGVPAPLSEPYEIDGYD